MVGDAAYQGLEIQVLDNHSPRYKDKLRPTQYHGSVYDLAPARRGFLKPTGEWNQQEIRALGRQITVTLNGTVIVDFDLDSVTDPEVLEKHPGAARQSGHIGFLGHGTKVEFRNIRIKELGQESGGVVVEGSPSQFVSIRVHSWFIFIQRSAVFPRNNPCDMAVIYEPASLCPVRRSLIPSPTV